MSNRRWIAAVAALSAAAVLASAAAARSGSRADLAYAAAQVAAASGPPTFTAPGPAFEASKARGK
jgi:hypothetical protein